MRHLNYNHLLYFWTVAKEGSIAKATQSLHLTPQTISGQLKLLEEAVGEPLFNRVGRGLTLTETGHIVFQYADEIFTLGAELSSRIKTGRVIVPAVLSVGIVNSIPKLVAARILQPVLKSQTPIRLVCREGNLETLLGELAVHQLDLVLSDRALTPGLHVKAFSHSLGSSETALFAHGRLARSFEKNFPHSLNDAAMLLPTADNPTRRGLSDWFTQQGLAPRIVAEFEDSALMKAFSVIYNGVFPSPLAISRDVEHMYGCKRIGHPIPVMENYFAISPERKLKHPAVLKIMESARAELFG
ncbi:MAG: Transcriptional activator protein NhaR [Pseudomonadota bacterium]|jgi:LysR family transcriptional activator of nhaA